MAWALSSGNAQQGTPTILGGEHEVVKQEGMLAKVSWGFVFLILAFE